MCIRDSPDGTLTFLLKMLREPEIPPASQQPGGKYDSTYAWQYYKSHYWDGINFYDERLVRTPIIEGKLDKYFEQVVYPCLLYTSDAADERSSVDLGGRRIIKKKK